MKYSIAHRVTSFFMSLLVVFSTLSFTVEKHYCGDTLVDTAIFSKVEKCGMELQANSLKKGCCKDDVKVVKGQDDLKLDASKEFKDADVKFLNAFVYAFHAPLFECLPKKIIPHKDYTPPNIIKDIQLLDDVFLI